jgi:hypothetical protein
MGGFSPIAGTSVRARDCQSVGTILAIIVVVLLVGTGGGFYGFRQHGGPGLGGAIVLVLIIFVVIWLAGGFRVH